MKNYYGAPYWWVREGDNYYGPINTGEEVIVNETGEHSTVIGTIGYTGGFYYQLEDLRKLYPNQITPVNDPERPCSYQEVNKFKIEIVSLESS